MRTFGRRLVRTLVSAVPLLGSWFPGLVVYGSAGEAARSVGPDLDAELLRDEAYLRAAEGETCVRCGRAFGPQDVTRTLKAGRVHDSCPA